MSIIKKIMILGLTLSIFPSFADTGTYTRANCKDTTIRKIRGLACCVQSAQNVKGAPINKPFWYAPANLLSTTCPSALQSASTCGFVNGNMANVYVAGKSGKFIMLGCQGV